MLRTLIFSVALLAVAGAYTQEHRELDAHEHGVGTVNIAIEGTQVAIELFVPGVDIVGFEHHPETDADKALVESAIATLSEPLSLIAIPAAAGCAVSEAMATLMEEEHEAHEEAVPAAGAEAHAEEEGEHAEFQATYALTCTAPSAITDLDFAYFALFPNARELDIQVITEQGTKGFEVSPQNTRINVADML